ncbi:Ras-related C3 botulinum toxin substrate 1 [Sarcoptes scabiei]|nr:Ras-related C3 botulinum toxin substrate 1 [Sarcoptes scabiei]
MPGFYSRYFGNYPAEYNRAIHGPYDPSRYYGRPDTKFTDVKLSELPAWINRRNVHPVAIFQACSRKYYAFINRSAGPLYSSPMRYFFQYITMASIFFYLACYPKNLRHHKKSKYHW